ncbi:NAD-dependent formate dehydrogenase delta subunit [plant metagenome]|uniref:NAD-dependent formate dehydrogenase delta subunit n=2 Tax=root TaxID=1 RepID=A0A1C3JY48_9BURK|nr:formate dehydrogenase subunit delta [Orrella dioscoreae]SBT24156.1 NAD-dependent formate dehydrogenase delta subunit [Orrella dioscoreae]SOE51396.1 NAD-dependent formate dehydrogenase delta subunit [Orrella dioscoreae]
MDIPNLIRMANRIGDFFGAMPDQAEAQEGITNHIQKFWEPRMRHALLDFLASHPDGRDGDVQLRENVHRAITDNLERLRPAA